MRVSRADPRLLQAFNGAVQTTPRRKRYLARAATVAFAITAAGAIAACAGSGHDKVVARVDQVPITSQTVQHWMVAMAGGRLPQRPSERRKLRQEALDFLITSQWLLGEASTESIGLTQREVERRFAQQRDIAFPGGSQEMRAFLKASGESVSDMLFQARAELAASKLRTAASGPKPSPTHAEIAKYYQRHRSSFEIPERRTVEIINRKSEAAALALKRKVAAGRSFTHFVEQRGPIPLSPESYSPSRGSDAIFPRAVHLAPLNRVMGPVLVHKVDHYLFRVTDVVRAREQPLAQVEGAIRRQLAADQLRRTLAAFVAAWRTRWIAQTTCSAGYVVQKCRQYRGPRAPEDPTTLD
jgi:foldase protein PrsA